MKPSNVLVVGDGEPKVKVIDFGIAKAIEQRDFEATLFTKTGQMVGTPAYMSPEQAGANADIDVRSDVYSLGVIFYEILVGLPPFDPELLRSAMVDEIRRVIREQDPEKPSLRAGAGETGIRRQELSGDLDWIAMKALEKDRDRRYGSAAAFGEDIRRFFDNEPVTAAAPSAIYRTQKFCRKYRSFLAAMAAVMVALCIGGALAMVQAKRANRSAKAEASGKLKALESLADSYVNSGLHAGDLGDYGGAQLWFTVAAEVAGDAGVEELERACRLRAARFERAGPVPVRRLPYASSKTELWASELDHSLQYLKISKGDYFTLTSLSTEELADFGTGETKFHAADVSPDGDYAAISIEPGKIRLIEIAGKTVTLELPAAEESRRLSYLRYSHDGRFLFCSAGSGWVWDVGNGAWLPGSIPFLAPVRWAKFSQDSNRLMTISVFVSFRTFLKMAPSCPISEGLTMTCTLLLSTAGAGRKFP